MTEVFTIFDWKGGVSKTTTAVNLAYGLARENKKVLLIDFDPQMNSTWTIQKTYYDKGDGTMYDPIIRKKALAPLVQETKQKNLFFLPSSTWMIKAEFKLASEAARERRLAKAIEPMLSHVDYVIIDTSPNLGVLTINALVASTALIIPTTANIYGVLGMNMLLSTVKTLQEEMNRAFLVFGVLITQVEGQTKNAREYIDRINDFFGRLVFDTMIPKNVKVAEAANQVQSLYEYAPNSTGAIAYAKFVQEVLLRDGTWEEDDFLQRTREVFQKVTITDEEE